MDVATGPGRTPSATSDVESLVEGIVRGDRGSLARAITLVESRAPRHRAAADRLIELVLEKTGGSQRIGITGVPGAGKSTFIDCLGMKLIAEGKRVAVLSVDPSSPISGGSILGDKTRMERLAREPNAFIRPSPSGGELGGVARKTRETICLCEAAGFDVVLVETVGVGQSEVLVRAMVDCFLVLTIAGAGDELQGMKKGILELADLLIVNKADGENRKRAELACAEFSRALHYLDTPDGGWPVRVVVCSARTGEGVADIWAKVQAYYEYARGSGQLMDTRRSQNLAWMNELVQQALRDRFETSPAVRSNRPAIESAAEKCIQLLLTTGDGVGPELGAMPGGEDARESPNATFVDDVIVVAFKEFHPAQF